MRPFEDYTSMTEEDREFVIRLLFYEYLQTINSNRRVNRGVQHVSELIDIDIHKNVILENYEVCVVLRDMKRKFKDDIEINDNL